MSRHLQVRRRVGRFVLPGLLWTVCFCAFVAASYRSSLRTINVELGEAACCHGYIEKNAIGAVRYVKYSDSGQREPVYSVCFSGLKAKGRQIGLLRTPVVKEVQVADLDIVIFQYSRGEAKRANEAGLFRGAGRGRSSNVLDYLLGRHSDLALDIDISNAVALQAGNFRYTVVKDGRAALEVRSTRAEVSVTQGEIILRGHAIVKNGKGRTLEGSRIRWGVLSERFSVEGDYSLGGRGKARTGRDICFDYDLRPIVDEGPNIKIGKNQRRSGDVAQGDRVDYSGNGIDDERGSGFERERL